MERGNSSDDQKRKRTRDDDEYEKKESHKISKKLTDLCDDEIGVFDFPWLKEGVVFRGDEYVEPEEERKFAACGYVEEVGPSSCGSSHLDQSSCVEKENLFVSHEKKVEDDEDDDDDSLWSLKVDDLEPLDRIWSCLVDQPLDIPLNKV